jgi:hypothetical protein
MESYDFDEADSVWEAHAGSPFPDVLQVVPEQVAAIEKKFGKKTQNDTGREKYFWFIPSAFVLIL